jgi:transglutaminase/protease-like cytokinesis protein 3
MVRVDGMWYHLDVTWDDPVPDQKGVVQYDHFLVSDRFIAKSRQFDQDTTVMLRPTAAAVFVDN